MSMEYLKNVATLRLDAALCIGCGMCVMVCPHDVFAIENKKAVINKLDSCMECGACARNCPVTAITVRAGVGCATAQINAMLGKGECCC